MVHAQRCRSKRLAADQPSKNEAIPATDERPLLEVAAPPTSARSAAMRNPSAMKPVIADDEERDEDDSVLGLGLDADAVRALRRSGGRIAHTMPTRKITPNRSAMNAYAW